MPGIVVGVDGSQNSERSLEWAMKEAGLRQVPLTVVAVHPVATSGWTKAGMSFPADAADEERARTAAQEEVDKVASEVGGQRPPSVTVRAESGVPAEVLINASKRRGHAGGRLAGQRRFLAAADGVGEQPGRAPRGVPGRHHPVRSRKLNSAAPGPAVPGPGRHRLVAPAAWPGTGPGLSTGAERTTSAFSARFGLRRLPLPRLAPVRESGRPAQVWPWIRMDTRRLPWCAGAPRG